MDAILVGIVSAGVVAVVMWICDGAARKRDMAAAQAALDQKDAELEKARELWNRFSAEADDLSKMVVERNRRIVEMNKQIGKLTEACLALTKRIEADEANPAPESNPAWNIGRDANGRFCKVPA